MPAPTPAHPPLHLKVFIGSPGDVNDERQLALKLLGQLPYDKLLQGKVTFEAVAWDHPQGGATFLAGLSAQDAVSRSLGKPADCDIVVVILWSRLGSPIEQPDYAKPDGGYYTGTEWEYYNARAAFLASGQQTPAVLLYHRTDAPKYEITPDNKPATDELYANLAKVDAFLQNCRAEDGSIPNQYQGPTGFAEALEQGLKDIVRQRLDELALQPSLAAREHHTSAITDVSKPIPAEPYWQGSPFPGLRPFTHKDAPIFFGRGREADDLLDRLRDPAQGFIAVVGASGSGKSSLVWAGVIPRLLAGALEGSERWSWVRFTPGELNDNPFTALCNAWKTELESQGLSVRDYAETLRQHPEELTGLMGLVFPELAIDDKADGLAASPFAKGGLRGIWESGDEFPVPEIPPNPPFAEGGNNTLGLDSSALTAGKGKPAPPRQCLIFIDQFEELFTVVKPDYRPAFVRLLLAASVLVAESTPRLRIVVSVRADFYAPCVEQGLAEALRTGSYPLAAPGRGALYQMVMRPAALGGLVFELGLDEAILDDTGDEPGALPLLAFALEQLYRKKTADGVLTHAAYEDFGKVQGAIGKRADAKFAKLPAEVQARFTEVFRELVEVDERGVPTRRRAKLSEVSHSPQSQQLVDALVKARLLVSDMETEAGTDNVPPFGKGGLGGISGSSPMQEAEKIPLNPPFSKGEAVNSTASRNANNPIATLEVAHEALFKSWAKLADWVTQTADDHRLRRQISQLAAYWDAHGRRDEHRWQDERVVEAKEMLEHLGLTVAQFDEREQAFLGPLDADTMLQEMQLPIPHERRAMIGVRLDRLGDTRKGVGLRADGLPDIDWVEIPGGEVTIEIREDARNPDSKLINTLTRPVAAFSLARYPVTVAQFQAFQRECHDGKRWHLPEDAPFNLPDSHAPPKPRAKHGNHPMDSVKWYDAVTFCHWLSHRLGYEVRLPTEFQWQCAAIGGLSSPLGRGVGVRGTPAEEHNSAALPPTQNYPWGEDWDPSAEPWRANTYESDLGRSTAVGLYPAGVSASGILDLSGTVWEWCQNAYDNPEEVTVSTGAARVVRGGSWSYLADFCRSAFRGNYSSEYSNDRTGFRCARVQA